MALGLDSPVTFEDMTNMFMIVTMHIVEHATLTQAAYEETLIDIANDLLNAGNQTSNPRMALGLTSLAQKLISTEPGADPV